MQANDLKITEENNKQLLFALGLIIHQKRLPIIKETVIKFQRHCVNYNHLQIWL